MSGQEMNLEALDAVISLEMDNGEHLECQIMFTFEVEELEYIVLLPINIETEEVLIFRYNIIDGTPVIENIEDDEEFARVSEEFDAILEEMDLEEE